MTAGDGTVIINQITTSHSATASATSARSYDARVLSARSDISESVVCAGRSAAGGPYRAKTRVIGLVGRVFAPAHGVLQHDAKRRHVAGRPGHANYFWTGAKQQGQSGDDCDQPTGV